MKPITVTSTGKQFATSTTAAATVLPFDSSGYYPKAIWVSATVPTYVKLTGPLSATAVAGDLLVQPADPVYLICQGYTGISALTISGTGVLNVAPAEVGSWGDGTSLSLAFTSMTSLDSRITFARADATSCATYFDSTGRLQTAAANVARFDYDPSTPAGVTGGELAPAIDTSWTRDATVSVVGSSFVFTNTPLTSNGAYKALALTAGKTYKVTLTTVNHTSGTVTAWLGAQQASTTNASLSASGTITFYVTPAALYNGNFIIGTNTGTTNATVSYVSVQECVMTPRGLLIEESRTNLLLQSRDMTQAAWTKTDVTPARTQVGIDGTANSACLMTEGSAGTAFTAQNGAAVTAGSTITASIVVKRGNTDWVQVFALDNTASNGSTAWFNLNTGVKGSVANNGTGTGGSSTITSLGGGWYRCTVTSVPSGAYTVPQWRMASASADNTGTRVSGATYIVDAAQLEVGSFATSYIPSAATSLTRAADSASMTGSNFSSWFNASAGTFVAEWDSALVNTNSAIVGTSSALSSIMYYNAGIRSYNGAVVLTGTGTATANATTKSSVAYDGSGRAIVLNGGSVATSTPPFTDVAITSISIGTDGIGSKPLAGHIRRLTYYPTRLTNAQLQSLTS